MSIDLVKYFTEAFSQPLTKRFLDEAEAISPAPDAPFKSWIGINFTAEALVSLKVYYTWYQDLHPSPVGKLLEPAYLLNFFDRYLYRDEAAIMDSVEYGSGFTVALRVDRSGPAGYGYVYRIQFDQAAELAADPFLQEYGRIPHILPGMGHYPVQQDEDCGMKHYHYFEDAAFSDHIRQQHFPFPLPPAPVVEYGVGTFDCELETAPPDCPRKVILLGNYQAVADAFLNATADWPMVQSIQELCARKGISALAPGKYVGENVWSLYLFAKEDMAKTQHMHTLRRFIPINI